MNLNFLEAHPPFFFFLVAIISLVVGSFLTVVIVRFPRSILQLEGATSIIFPRSHCPNCKHSIYFLHNIPILSFIILKGHCYFCKDSISIRYFYVECLTLIASFLIAAKFGLSIQMPFALILTWILIVLAFIDLEYFLLPDRITLPGTLIGILLSFFSIFQNSIHAILGMFFGYLILWTFYSIYKFFTHKEGIGFGDFKLLALLGTWLGWQYLPLMIFLSSFFASLIGIFMITFLKKNRYTPIPFGPFLSLAGFIALLCGRELNQFYLRMLHL